MTPLPIGRPRFITTEEALAWHELAIARYGGMRGVRDRGLLDSALAMPRQGTGGEFMHAHPFEMAAAYAYHLARNHPFIDGNKRVALWCCGAFLRMNGWSLDSIGIEAADKILALTAGTLDKAGMAAWLQTVCRQRPSFELRDFMGVLSFKSIHEQISAGLADSDPGRAHQGRLATMQEAERAIPAITAANLGAVKADGDGDHAAAQILRSYSHLLTALHRIAEDMGYEW